MDTKAIRERLNLTQEQLAQKIGVSWVTVARWERGIVKTSPLAQKAIENLLKETSEGGTRNEVGLGLTASNLCSVKFPLSGIGAIVVVPAKDL